MNHKKIWLLKKWETANIAKQIRLRLLGNYITLAMMADDIKSGASFEEIAKFIEKEMPEVRERIFKDINNGS